MSGAEAGDYQALFGFSGGGFLDDGVDAVEVRAAGEALTAGRAVMRQEIFTGGLYSGDGAGMGFGDLNQLLGAAFCGAANIKVVADQMEEGVVAYEIARAEDGVPIAEGLGLGNEAEASGVVARDARVRRFVAGADYDGDLFDAGAQGFFDDDAEDWFFNAIAIDEGL
jgi:hypothetical protein